MKILHTADWHLGRMLNGRDLLEDQIHTLEAVVRIAREEMVQAILIAGDIYDRSQPPERAMQVYDKFITLLRGVAPVFVIAGNHDSAVRIEQYSVILGQQGLHLAGTQFGPPPYVELKDQHGPVHFYLMPYATTDEVREATRAESVSTHEIATSLRLKGLPKSNTRSVLVGHLFAAGGKPCDSERDIAVGGVSQVSLKLFKAFTYTALGHLHRPHNVASGDLGTVRYSGSLCRYSFSEEDHDKSLSIIDMDAKGHCTIKEVPLPQRLGMRTIRGNFDQILSAAASDPRRTLDLIRIVLKDHIPVNEAQSRLQQFYPHLCELSYELTPVSHSGTAPTMDDLKNNEPLDFMHKFLQDRYGDAATPEIRKLGEKIMQEVVEQRNSA